MRNNHRRVDTASATKLQEIRNMGTAFGNNAAALLGEQDFVDPRLVKVALSSRHERRQRFRRSTDCPNLVANSPSPVSSNVKS